MMPELVERWRCDFIELVASPQPPLLESALALSRLLQRGNIWPGALVRLHQLEQAARRRCAPVLLESDARATEMLLQLLADEGFVGDTECYEDPENSFIDRVLERGRGLPITLSILALHLGRQTGIVLHGVGFPGHFVVGTDLHASEPAVFDPFGQGRRLQTAELAAIYRAATGRPMTPSTPMLRALLRPVTNRSIVSRMLRNLQRHYAIRGAHDRVAEVVGLLVAMHPELENLRTLQGELHRRLEELN